MTEAHHDVPPRRFRLGEPVILDDAFDAEKKGRRTRRHVMSCSGGRSTSPAPQLFGQAGDSESAWQAPTRVAALNDGHPRRWGFEVDGNEEDAFRWFKLLLVPAQTVGDELRKPGQYRSIR
jgi:hypothetical protein